VVIVRLGTPLLGEVMCCRRIFDGIVGVMPKDELIIQLIKIALGVAIGSYFLWWSLEVLQRLPPR
jgi:hypothetical protein